MDAILRMSARTRNGAAAAPVRESMAVMRSFSCSLPPLAVTASSTALEAARIRDPLILRK